MTRIAEGPGADGPQKSPQDGAQDGDPGRVRDDGVRAAARDATRDATRDGAPDGARGEIRAGTRDGAARDGAPHDPRPGAAGRRPRLWVVTRDLGVTSQVWLLRQVEGFRRLDPVVVTWKDHRPSPAPDGVRVHVLPFRPDLDGGRDRWWNRGLRLHHGNFLASQGAERRHLMALARRDPPDVILAHFGHAALRVLPVAKALGVPLVCHFHGLDLSSSLRNPWYRRSLLRHLGDFAAVVTVGSRQAEWMAGHRAAGAHVIPCGVPVAEFSRHPGDPDPVPEGGVPDFVVISRLVPQKGVDVCLRALARLPPGAARLTVIGDGPEEAALKRLAADLGLAGAVAFRGPLPSSGVRAALLDARALIQHSLDWNGWFEGFGVTVSEASAMALPTIASRCGGLMDQVADGETGLLVDQRDEAGLAAAMARLAGDAPLARRMGQAARARAVARFDTARQIARLEEVLIGAAARTG